MGSAYAWLAMKDTSADEACAAVNLVRSGEGADHPESVYFSGTALPGGWYVVATNEEAFDYFMDMDLGDLSAARDLAVFEAEEHMMYFSLAYWQAGARLWEVNHDGQQGVYHLDAEGELPATFDALHAEFKAKQDAEGGTGAGVDYLAEVPQALARHITGFGYNFSYPAGEEPAFEELHYAGDAEESSDPDTADSPGESGGQPPPAAPQSGPDTGPEPSQSPKSWWQRLFGG